MIGYYFITDAGLSRKGNAADIRSALEAGVKFIQYRDKNAGSRKMYSEALRLLRLCRRATFLVNDRIDIALAIGADGVHLGQGDLPCVVARRLLGKKKVIGITVHSFKQAREALRQGASYLAVAPVFATTTKSDASWPIGVGLIRRIKKELDIPVVAIGGINLSNAEKVVRAGADGLCAISAVVTRADAGRQMRKFARFFK